MKKRLLLELLKKEAITRKKKKVEIVGKKKKGGRRRGSVRSSIDGKFEFFFEFSYTLRGVETVTFFCCTFTIAGCTNRKLKIYHTHCGLYNPQFKKIYKFHCGLYNPQAFLKKF